jgi:hypothetical protein
VSITIDGAIESLRKVVAERGRDYIYAAEARAEKRVRTAREIESNPDHFDFDNPRFDYLGWGLDAEARRQKYIDNSGKQINCVYAEESEGVYTGSCGVGRALEIDFPEVFTAVVEREADENESFGIMDVGHDDLTEEAARVYAEFQEAQDAGKPYGEALDRAESKYAEISR